MEFLEFWGVSTTGAFAMRGEAADGEAASPSSPLPPPSSLLLQEEEEAEEERDNTLATDMQLNLADGETF